MVMRRAIIVTACLLLGGCYSAYQPRAKYRAINNASVNVDLEKTKIFNSLISVLVDAGFDIKMSDQGIGLITTEWKLIDSALRNQAERDDQAWKALAASLGGRTTPIQASFDDYIQVKMRVLERDGKIQIKVLPIIKTLNRLNQNAFTERSLAYDWRVISGSLSALTNEHRYMLEMQYFVKILSDMANDMGIDKGSFEITYSYELLTGSLSESFVNDRAEQSD